MRRPINPMSGSTVHNNCRKNWAVFIFTMMSWSVVVAAFGVLGAAGFMSDVHSFSVPPLPHQSCSHPHQRGASLIILTGTKSDNDSDDESSSSLSNYEDSDGASTLIVGSLTGLVNTVSAALDREELATSQPSTTSSSSMAKPLSSPKTPEELLERIRAEYTERNYLWTGDIDERCFFDDCTFTDPTISFQGVDTFKTNTQNLVPIVEAFAEDYSSNLLSISIGSDKNDGSEDAGVYVETRWNMVGSLTAKPWFFWKPKIDVIGRTKFWFRRDVEGDESSSSDPSANEGGSGYKVYFYDESWEIPAWKALLQIVTPAGTFPSTSAS